MAIQIKVTPVESKGPGEGDGIGDKQGTGSAKDPEQVMDPAKTEIWAVDRESSGVVEEVGVGVGGGREALVNLSGYPSRTEGPAVV